MLGLNHRLIAIIRPLSIHDHMGFPSKGFDRLTNGIKRPPDALGFWPDSLQMRITSPHLGGW